MIRYPNRQPEGDFPRQPRPAGGFVRPMYTCARCWCTSAAFYLRVFHRCPACWVPVYPLPKERAS